MTECGKTQNSSQAHCLPNSAPEQKFPAPRTSAAFLGSQDAAGPEQDSGKAVVGYLERDLDQVWSLNPRWQSPIFKDWSIRSLSLGPIAIPNLRATRLPLRSSWEVQGTQLNATVRPIAIPGTALGQNWRLEVEVNPNQKVPWNLKTVTGPDFAQVHFDSADPTLATGSRSFTVDFNTPQWCDARREREPLVVELKWSDGTQDFQESLELDYRCLVGDVFEVDNYEAMRKQNLNFLRDPLIEKLVQQVKDQPLGSPQEEAARLAALMGLSLDETQQTDVLKYRPDPIEGSSEMAGYEAYWLSPTETWRYGGDCEDLAGLVIAFLVRRGVQGVHAATHPRHAWVEVPPQHPEEPYTIIDFTETAIQNFPYAKEYTLTPVSQDPANARLPIREVKAPEFYGNAHVVTFPPQDPAVP